MVFQVTSRRRSLRIALRYLAQFCVILIVSTYCFLWIHNRSLALNQSSDNSEYDAQIAMELQMFRNQSDALLQQICPSEEVARGRRRVQDVLKESDFELVYSLQHVRRSGPFPLPLGALDRFCKIMTETLPRKKEAVPEYCLLQTQSSYFLQSEPEWVEGKWRLADMYPCSEKTLVGRVSNVFLDYGSEHPDVVGTLFDRERYFCINTYDWDHWAPHCTVKDLLPAVSPISGEANGKEDQQKEPQQASESILKVYNELASALTVYGYAFAHVTVELLPRFLILLKQIPAHVPLLVERGSMQSYISFLHDGGLLDEKRIVWYDRLPRHLIYAKRLYFLTEWPVCGDRHGGRGFQWQSAEQLAFVRRAFHQASQHLSDSSPALIQGQTLPQRWPLKQWIQAWSSGLAEIKQRLSFCTACQQIWDRLVQLKSSDKQNQNPGWILVSDRPTSSKRKLANAVDLVGQLQARLPAYAHRIVYFAAEGLPLETVIDLFRQQVSIFISPHGATLAHMMWLQPGSGVLEVAYMGTRAMPFPSSYYYTIAINLGLSYGVVDADEGEYDTDMKVNVEKVVPVLEMMLQQQEMEKNASGN